MAKRCIRLGEGTGMIVGPLRLFVIAPCSAQQHSRIIEQGIDQFHHVVGHAVFIGFHVGADAIDQRLGIGDMLWSVYGCCGSTKPYGEGGCKKRQHRYAA